MTNLYFKSRLMCNSFLKKLRHKKSLFLLMFLFFGFIGGVFAQTRLYFSPGNIYPILNNGTVYNTGVLVVDSDGIGVTSYGVDLHNQSELYGEIDPNNKLNVISNSYSPSLAGLTMSLFGQDNSREYNANLYKVWEFAGTDNTSVAGLVSMNNQNIGAVFVMNSGTHYLTSAYLDYFVSGTNSTTKLSGSPYDQLSGLNIYFWACPENADTVDPTFPNNQSTVDTNPNFPDRQINRQYRDDFSWIFGLLDNTNTYPGSNGWIDTPDFDAGTNFRPNVTDSADISITNQNGINTGSFRLDINVATGWDHSTNQTSWSSWDSEITYTNGSAGVALTGRGKTWRYWDKNYTGQISTANISDFGIEELVMISGYIEDRDMGYPGFNGTQTWNVIKGYSYWSGNNDYDFVYYFNQGMRPWFNQDTTGSYHHDATCKLDVTQSQNGYWVAFTGVLHDDWAGIDTDTFQVIVTGTIAGVPDVSIYTWGSNQQISAEQFTFTGNGCRIDGTTTSACTPTTSNNCGNTTTTYPGSGTPMVCDDGNRGSTGNWLFRYENNIKIYDPETPVYVSVLYSDNKGKDARPVSCDWGVEKAPRFVGTGNRLSNWLSYLTSLINLSNHPNGAQFDPMHIQLQDEWAGVDNATIDGALSGQTLNGSLDNVVDASANLDYNTNNIYTQINSSSLWLQTDNYPNVNLGYVKTLLNTVDSYTQYLDWLGNGVTNIYSFQNLNYQLEFDQTDGGVSTFNDYFAPEHPIDFNLTFDDKNGSTVYNDIDVTYINNEEPEFWSYEKTTNFVGGSDQLSSSNTPIGISLTGDMEVLFSGNVNSGENRIYPYDLTGDNYSQIGTIKQTDIAFKVTDNWAGVDSGTVTVTVTGQRWGQPYTYIFTGVDLDFTGFDRGDIGNWNILNYLVELIGHDIYFDWQSRGGSAPVPGRESRYTINLSADDLKQPIANNTSLSYVRDMENLSCQYLDRCNARLYFTYDYGTGVVPVVQTGVHPFLGQTLYVIASGSQIIYTGVNENYIACNGAGTLGSPIDLDFENGLLVGGETDPYNDYQHSVLDIKDGDFELSGSTLILK